MKYNKLILSGCLLIAVFIFIFIALPASLAVASPIGPNHPSLGQNVSTVGTEAWSNPESITAPGSPYATVNLYHGHQYSNFLQGTQYGFNIPAGSIITGIEVLINRMSIGPAPVIVDTVVSLVYNGAVIGDNKASTADWPTTLSENTYGGPTDLWGTALTPEQVNHSTFGITLQANRGNNGKKDRYATVDTMKIRVYYSYNTTTALDCGNGVPVTTYGEPITCLATVSSSDTSVRPTGTVNWQTSGFGSFNPNPCTLTVTGGVSSCSVTYTPTSVGSGSHQLTGTYQADDLFAYSSATQVVTVNLRPVTVTADPKTKFIWELDPALTHRITQGSLVFDDAFSGTLTRDPGEAVGTYAIRQGTLSLPADYTLTFVGNTLSITYRFLYMPWMNK